MLLSLHIFSTQLRQLVIFSKSCLEANVKCRLARQDLEKWYSENKIFFILSLGRSGTKFLTKLLHNSNDETIVYHEPVPSDFLFCQLAFWNIFRESYVTQYRLKEIYFRLSNKSPSCSIYGEVNSALRRHVVPLQKNLPRASFLHLVRDGRDVVRSMMSRKTFTKQDPNSIYLKPKLGDKWYDKWFSMTRFEKCCWYWSTENAYLRGRIARRVHFEDILSSYKLFKGQVLVPLGIELEEDVWQASVQRPINKTKYFALGSWDDWSRKQKDQFVHICGEEMQRYGYKIS